MNNYAGMIGVKKGSSRKVRLYDILVRVPQKNRTSRTLGGQEVPPFAVCNLEN